jgi:hypothetical protein
LRVAGAARFQPNPKQRWALACKTCHRGRANLEASTTRADGVDDVTAAAVLNPGMAARKTLVWEGELTAGPVGARARRHRHVRPDRRPAGHAPRRAGGRRRAQSARGADAAIEVDRPREELAAAVAYRSLLQQVAAGEITVAIDPVPLTQVEKTWRQAGSDRRVVFVP